MKPASPVSGAPLSANTATATSVSVTPTRCLIFSKRSSASEKFPGAGRSKNSRQLRKLRQLFDSCISNVLFCGPEVRMRPSGSPEELERRRRRAIELLNEGFTPVEVARRLDVDR